MTAATPLQTSIDPLRWDLTSIYSSLTDPRIDNDLKSALSTANALSAKFKGRVSSLNPNEVLELIDGLETVHYRSNRPSWFTSLLFNAQTDDVAVRTLQNQVQTMAAEISNVMTWAELELKQLPEDTQRSWLEAPELSKYRHFIAANRRFCEHLLSEPEENILNLTELTGRKAWTHDTRIDGRSGSSLTHPTRTRVAATCHDGIGCRTCRTFARADLHRQRLVPGLENQHRPAALPEPDGSDRIKR
jgi:oligoendopeptidase F